MFGLDGGFVVSSQIRLDFVDVFVGVGKPVMDVGRLQGGLLLHDLFHTHALPVAGEDGAHSDPRARHDWLPPTAQSVLLDVPVVQLAHLNRLRRLHGRPLSPAPLQLTA